MTETMVKVTGPACDEPFSFVLNLCFRTLDIICYLRFAFCYFRLARTRVYTATFPSET